MLMPVLLLIIFLSGTFSVYCFKQMVSSIIKYKVHDKTPKEIPINQVPSVTVCIAARNETHAMTQCLEAVINSDYPKLEIIVLDDNSVDNTSILIKSFASAGVRFVSGDTLPEGWIGRNFAYKKLLQESNGKYIFFMSVDTHIEKNTITQIMGQVHTREAEMISVMPVRLDNYRLSVIFAPLRFFGELVLKYKNRPPVTSSTWVVNRQLLKEYAGDLSEYKNDIMIESKIGRRFAKDGKYDFIISPIKGNPVSFEKRWISQVETSIRIYALGVNGYFFKALLFFFLLLLINIPPFLISILYIFNQDVILMAALASIELLFMITYAIYAKAVWSKGFILAFLTFPIIAIQELVIFFVAIFKRLTGTVTWKGRNIYSGKG